MGWRCDKTTWQTVPVWLPLCGACLQHIPRRRGMLGSEWRDHLNRWTCLAQGRTRNFLEQNSKQYFRILIQQAWNWNHWGRLPNHYFKIQLAHEISKNRGQTTTFKSPSSPLEIEMSENRTQTTTFKSPSCQLENEMSKNRSRTITFRSWSTQPETEMSKNRTETTTFRFSLILWGSDSARTWKYFGWQHWQIDTFEVQTHFLPR